MDTPSALSYENLGYDAENRTVHVRFFNPFRTEKNQDDEAFADHTRSIKVVIEDGKMSIEKTKERINQVANGVLNKMEIANKAAVSVSKANQKAIEKEFGVFTPEVEEVTEN